MADETFFDVRRFGAKGVARPGETLALSNLQYKWISYPAGTKAVIYHPAERATYDSVGIQQAIDSAHCSGGGTVIVPAGEYLIAPIRLRSRVCLHLEPGANLWGSPHLADYKADIPSFTPQFPLERGISHFHQIARSGLRPLIWADDAEDIAITGIGQINAQSPQWIIPWMNSRPTTWDSLDGLRPRDTISFYRCRRVRVQGVRILQSPSWTLVFDTCHDVQVRGVQLRSFEAINSDGIDLVNTSNATISDCDIWATDDAICLKNLIADHTMANIAVNNCVIRTACNGLKIGTESIGNFQDITFTNCVIYNPDDDMKGAEGGINLCAMDGGFVRNVNVSDIVMRNVDCPLYLLSSCRTGKQKSLRTPRSGTMERISISNIQADGARHTSWIVGRADQPIRDVRLRNINVRKTRDFYDAPVTTPVPELPEAYPSPCRFGRRHQGDDLPAYGLYLRHANDISVKDFRVEFTRPDAREFIVQENCSDVLLEDCSTKTLNT